MEKCHEILMCISILWLAYETIHGIYAMKVTLISCIFPGGDLTFHTCMEKVIGISWDTSLVVKASYFLCIFYVGFFFPIYFYRDDSISQGCSSAVP